MITHAAASNWSNITVGLRAISESTKNQWKRFKYSSPRLAITYNTNPNAPTPGTAGSWDATSYAFNRKGQLVTVTDPAGNDWTYAYDIRGRQTSADDPDKGVTTSTYDNAGRVTSTTDARGKKLAYLYDRLGRKLITYSSQCLVISGCSGGRTGIPRGCDAPMTPRIRLPSPTPTRPTGPADG